MKSLIITIFLVSISLFSSKAATKVDVSFANPQHPCVSGSGSIHCESGPRTGQGTSFSTGCQTNWWMTIVMASQLAEDLCGEGNLYCIDFVPPVNN